MGTTYGVIPDARNARDPGPIARASASAIVEMSSAPACAKLTPGNIWRTSLALFLLFISPACAAPFFEDHALTDPQRYDRCLALAHQDPDSAYEQALAWHDAGGGPAAAHCAAVSLFQGKHYAEAAFKFDALAHEHDAGDAGLRAQLLDQAGNAWFLAGQPQRAEASMSAALNLGDTSADIYADRARVRAFRKDWSGAEADLDDAIARDEYRADLLVLRATARHALGRRKTAEADLDAALAIDPHYVDALVERGAMRAEDGDVNGARADFLLVLATEPKSGAAEAARARLQQLDLKTSRRPPKTIRH